MFKHDLFSWIIQAHSPMKSWATEKKELHANLQRYVILSRVEGMLHYASRKR